MHGIIPRVINECLTEVEKRGLTEVGICVYRPSSKRCDEVNVVFFQIELLVPPRRSTD